MRLDRNLPSSLGSLAVMDEGLGFRVLGCFGSIGFRGFRGFWVYRAFRVYRVCRV